MPDRRMRVLITGITGFVGSHMAELCLEKGCEVHGTNRWRSDTVNINHLRDKITLHEADLVDPAAVREVIEEVKPDLIFHLAAQSFVKASWTNPSHTMRNNTVSQINIFEAVRKIPDYNPKIQIAGSSEEYGHAACLPNPITEDEPLLPLSPYGVSKVAQDLLGYQYHKSYGLHVVRTRGFNHTGPRRGEVFVCATFAKQIVAIEKGQQKTIKVGNLEAIRDFTDVRDMVNGYWLALEKGEAGDVYNICSGTRGAYTMESILQMLIDLSTAEIKIEEDPERMRPSDLPTLVGSAAKFRTKTGWRPKIKMEQTLKDIIEHERSK